MIIYAENVSLAPQCMNSYIVYTSKEHGFLILNVSESDVTISPK